MKYKNNIYRVVCAIVLSLLSPLSYAYDFEIDGNYYTLISTSERTVAFAGTTLSGKLVIPEKIVISNKEFTVTSIEGGWMKKTGENVKSIVVPKTVTILERSCFYGGQFEEISLPSTLTEIGEMAFQNCSQLKEIEIPNNVTSIGHFAFHGCSSLTHIVLPKSERCSIGAAAFCSGPQPKGKLIIPAGIYFANDYHSNGDHYVAFDDCSELDSLIFEDSNAHLYAYNGILFTSRKTRSSEFGQCNNLKYVYIGRPAIHYWGSDDYGNHTPVFAKVVEYGDKCEIQYSYRNVYTDFATGALEKITFGKKLSNISSYTNSGNLVEVYMRNETPPSASVFSNYTYIHGTLYVPKGTLKVYQEADVWKEFWNIEEYDVPEYPIGIRPVSVQEEKVLLGIYDINGIKHDIPVKGLNIYRYKDGHVKKNVK